MKKTNERVIIYIMSLVVLLGMVGWLAPRAIGLYYQSIGGRILDEETRSAGMQGRPDEIAEATACERDTNLDEHNQARLVQAIRNLQKAIHFSPGASHSYLLLGRSFCLLGNPEKAVQAYRKYTSLRTRNPLGYLELGFAYEAAYRKQIVHISQSFELETDCPPYPDPKIISDILSAWKTGGREQDFFESGNQARIAGKYEEALDWYSRAVCLGVAEAKFFFFFTLGLLYEQKESWFEALDAFRNASQEIKRDISPAGSLYYHKGLIQKVQFNEWDNALQSFDLALKSPIFVSDWELADTHYHRGVILNYSEKEREAMQEFQLAVETVPNHYGALIELGWANWNINHDLRTADDNLQRAIKEDPNAKWAYRALGDVYLEAGMFEKALLLYEKVIGLDPSDTETQKRINDLKSK